MKTVLTPEPIDRKRALVDAAYFAEKYLDLKLSDSQVKAVEAVVFRGENAQLGGYRPHARQEVFKTITALARMKGMRVNVVEKEEFIDV